MDRQGAFLVLTLLPGFRVAFDPGQIFTFTSMLHCGSAKHGNI